MKKRTRNTNNLTKKYLKDYKHYGNFLNKIHINYENSVFTFAGLITGCGIAQMQGNRYLENYPKLTKVEFFNLIKPILNSQSRIGAIVATLGDHQFSYGVSKAENKMLELGFVQVAKYLNPQDGRNYYQRLYVLDLNQKI